MELKKGDIVFVTDEDLKGTVIDIVSDEVKFLSEDGFEYKFPVYSVFKLDEKGQVIHQKKEYQPTSNKPKKKSEAATSVSFDVRNPVFDLHIEALCPDRSFPNEHEALVFQLETAREIIAICNRKRIRKLTLIHGVGKGKLRKELRNLLSESYPEIEYLDGNYRKYGAGATDLIIHQFDSID